MTHQAPTHQLPSTDIPSHTQPVNGLDAQPFIYLSFQVPCPRKSSCYTGPLAEHPTLARPGIHNPVVCPFSFPSVYSA